MKLERTDEPREPSASRSSHRAGCRVNLDQYRTLCSNLGLDPVTGDVPKREKYGRRKTAIDGTVFDSAAEARRYVELKAMQQAGLIADLFLQPRFLLQEPFRDAKGKWHRKVEFVADFRYINGHVQTIVEDVKGVRTPAFNIKWKLAIARYPQIDFRIIGGKR